MAAKMTITHRPRQQNDEIGTRTCDVQALKIIVSLTICRDLRIARRQEHPRKYAEHDDAILTASKWRIGAICEKIMPLTSSAIREQATAHPSNIGCLAVPASALDAAQCIVTMRGFAFDIDEIRRWRIEAMACRRLARAQ